MIRVDDGMLTYFRQPPQLEGSGLVWATFSRLGGFSTGVYKSLNVGYHVGDRSDIVTSNRGQIVESLAIPAEYLVAAQQVHGTGVAIIGQEHRGIGATRWEDALPHTDAMVTAAKDTFPMIVVADCVALTYYDPTRQVLGIAHCGWKGMVAKLGQKTVVTMVDTFGCQPDDLILIASPSIGPCCYEVGELVLSPLRQTFPTWVDFVRESNGKTRLDLWEMARWQALDSGLKPENIHLPELCTSCRTDLFYSHRAEGGSTGRFAVVAGIR